MDAETLKRVSALQCAVRALDGTAGGYTAADKADAKLVLMDMILEFERRKQ